MNKEDWTIEDYRRKGKHYGAFWTHNVTGQKVYFAYRKRRHIYRDTTPSISSAINKGNAYWALDIETLYAIRRKCFPYTGVLVLDEKKRICEVFITHTDKFMDRTLTKNIDRSSRSSEGCTDQRYLPFSQFKHKIITHELTKLATVR